MTKVEVITIMHMAQDRCNGGKRLIEDGTESYLCPTCLMTITLRE
jgi:hypothetical protein